MIKFIAGDKDKKNLVVGLGLSFANLEKLKEGFPIVFEGHELMYGEIQNLDGTAKFIIFADETEEKIVKGLNERFSMEGTNIRDFRTGQDGKPLN